MYEDNLKFAGSVDESNIEPTIQIRSGVQYILQWLRYQQYETIIPIRGGIFYDPAPAEDGRDDYYGFSTGSGVSFKKNDRLWFSFDLAYQYRYGQDVGSSILEHLDFSQDVSEHMLYASWIQYF